MATTGWVTKAVPPVEPEGLVVKASLLAEPVVIVKLALTPLVSPAEVADSVYVPALSMPQPAKVATPATAALGFAVHVRAAPAGVVMLRVTGALLTSTVWPWASVTATMGCATKETVAAESEGFVVKTRLVAGPAVPQELPTDKALAVNAAAAKPRGAMARATAVKTATRATAADPVSIRILAGREAIREVRRTDIDSLRGRAT